jgi:hypothetical protein
MLVMGAGERWRGAGRVPALHGAGMAMKRATGERDFHVLCSYVG